jgi:hypothetical protein
MAVPEGAPLVNLCSSRGWSALLPARTARIEMARSYCGCFPVSAREDGAAVEYSERAAAPNRFSQADWRRGCPRADLDKRDGRADARRISWAFLRASVGTRLADTYSPRGTWRRRVVTVLWSAGTLQTASMAIATADWSWIVNLHLSSLFVDFSQMDVRQQSEAASGMLAGISWVLMLVLGVVGLVVLLVAFLAAAGVGMASLKAALYFRIAIEAIPAGSHRLDLVDTSSPSVPGSMRLASGGLSHSVLYNSPGAIDAVIEALAGFERRRADRNPGSGGTGSS